MRILLLASAFNGLCQRAYVELSDRRHEVSVALSTGDQEVRKAIQLFQPHLIICPFLKEPIPADIYENHTCVVLHPGIVGDRGPSSLDWAILNRESEWGVTALQAAEEMDAGDIWASHTFPMRRASKASLYRHEVTRAMIGSMLETVRRFEEGNYAPEPLRRVSESAKGRLRPLMKQSDRAIAWHADDTETVIRKVNSADSAPGVLDRICGADYYLYGVHREDRLRGCRPGEIIAQRHGAICRATIDGAVWISHLRRKAPDGVSPGSASSPRGCPTFKLPSAMVLGDAVRDVPESPVDPLWPGAGRTFQEIWYEERNQVGYLHFDFHNGAMSTAQCRRLQESYELALQRPTKVLVLMGGSEFWSNGIHLNMIEAATDAAGESWRNINAIDDVVLDIINTSDRLVVASLWGSAGAGGAMMPLAADYIWAREGCILNPHYRTMGLYGSEYWTYLLPRRVGPALASELTDTPLPIGAHRAKSIGLVDAILPDDPANYDEQVRIQAESLAQRPDYRALLANKQRARMKGEARKPLAEYRAEELGRMWLIFHGKHVMDDVCYHQARFDFVHKVKPLTTPAHLSRCRSQSGAMRGFG